MNIYPYVYRLDHPVTGEFYIGYRSANKVPAEQDLGIKYFTSSKYVKPRFHEFNITILAEFFDKEAAYEFEQSYILNHFSNHLCLNKVCYLTNRSKHYEKDIRLSNRKVVCRIFDKKEMTIQNYYFWIKCLNEEFLNKIKSDASKRQKNIPKSKEHNLKNSLALKGKPKQKTVCRIFDKKEMTMGNYNNWLKFETTLEYVIKKQSKLPKTKAKKLVCRLSDRKVMATNMFFRWENKLSD